VILPSSPAPAPRDAVETVAWPPTASADLVIASSRSCDDAAWFNTDDRLSAPFSARAAQVS
jgi:hypothetical protein